MVTTDPPQDCAAYYTDKANVLGGQLPGTTIYIIMCNDINTRYNNEPVRRIEELNDTDEVKT